MGPQRLERVSEMSRGDSEQGDSGLVEGARELIGDGEVFREFEPEEITLVLALLRQADGLDFAVRPELDGSETRTESEGQSGSPTARSDNGQPIRGCVTQAAFPRNEKTFSVPARRRSMLARWRYKISRAAKIEA